MNTTHGSPYSSLAARREYNRDCSAKGDWIMKVFTNEWPFAALRGEGQDDSLTQKSDFFRKPRLIPPFHL
jgi:hypothetical protein